MAMLAARNLVLYYRRILGGGAWCIQMKHGIIRVTLTPEETLNHPSPTWIDVHQAEAFVVGLRDEVFVGVQENFRRILEHSRPRCFYFV